MSTLGGKATQLLVLSDLGFPVPPFLALSGGEAAALAEGSGEVADRIVSTVPFPLAVRSSAAMEDGPNHSFAGLFRTVLGVPDRDSLVSAAATVVEGATSAEVLAYCAQNDLEPPTSMPLLVQTMVRATAAGVGFSRDPLSGDDVVLIESTWGLGSHLVDAKVTPDRIVFEDSALIDFELGERPTQLLLGRDGTVELHPTSESERNQLSLPPHVASELAAQITRIEDHYGTPQDVEWAWDGDRLFVVQARPITTHR